MFICRSEVQPKGAGRKRWFGVRSSVEVGLGADDPGVEAEVVVDTVGLGIVELLGTRSGVGDGWDAWLLCVKGALLPASLAANGPFFAIAA